MRRPSRRVLPTVIGTSLAATLAVAAVNCGGAAGRLVIFSALARIGAQRFERARRSARFWLLAHLIGLRRSRVLTRPRRPREQRPA